MPINQKWIGNISGDNGQLIDIHIVDVIYKSDTSSLSCISWLHDSNVLFAIVLLQLLVMLVEFTKLVRENVSVWNKVKMLLSVSLLHSDDVETEPVLSSDFMTRWEVIYLLVFVKAFVKVTFATT
jgi:hypothetical protein